MSEFETIFNYAPIQCLVHGPRHSVSSDRDADLSAGLDSLSPYPLFLASTLRASSISLPSLPHLPYSTTRSVASTIVEHQSLGVRPNQSREHLQFDALLLTFFQDVASSSESWPCCHSDLPAEHLFGGGDWQVCNGIPSYDPERTGESEEHSPRRHKLSLHLVNIPH